MTSTQSFPPNQEWQSAMSNDTMEYPDIPMPAPTVHASHPFRNKANHARLLKYVQDRLKLGAQRRDDKLSRLVNIDRAVAGWIRHKNEDAKRVKERLKHGTPVAVNQHLPLTWVHLDDMMTYYAAVFAPNRGMFYATSKPDETKDTNQLLTLMNNHAIYASYYREVLSSIYSLLKYNEGGFYMAWSKTQGPKLVRKEDGSDVLETETVWQGNRIESLDMYNFLYDSNCEISKLHEDGEFAGTARLRSRYWLQKKALEGLYHIPAESFKRESKFGNEGTYKYYRSPPAETRIGEALSDGVGSAADGVENHTNWMSVLGRASRAQAEGHEVVTLHIRIDPTMFGLVDATGPALKARKRLETWRITVLNDCHIIEAVYMNNIHGHLPYYVGLMTADNLEDAQKSNAEILMPLQDFASFLLNIHVQGSRKKLVGTTFYDPSAVDMNAIPDGEVAARVPLKAAAFGRDIRSIVYESNQGPDTGRTMEDVSQIMELVNMFFPTQALPSQVAGIDRAVSGQVAAVIQGANRRQQMRARLVDDTLFKHVRFAMYYNIIQYQPDKSQVVDYYTGSNLNIDLNKLRNSDLPFVIGQGLKAIDREAVVNQIQNLIFAILQSQRANEQIDVVGLMGHWINMMDVDIDMEKFRIQPQQDPNAAGAVDGPGIQPATGASTLSAGPVYGEQL